MDKINPDFGEQKTEHPQVLTDHSTTVNPSQI